MIRRLLPILLLLHAALFLLPPGLNLCVHVDGSWRLESALFPCCGGASEGPSVEREDCAQCSDYPVPSPGDAVVTPGPESSAPAACVDALAAAAVSPVAPWPPPARFGECGPPRASPRGLLPSFVVLRC